MDLYLLAELKTISLKVRPGMRWVRRSSGNAITYHGNRFFSLLPILMTELRQIQYFTSSTLSQLSHHQSHYDPPPRYKMSISRPLSPHSFRVTDDFLFSRCVK